MTPVKKTFVLLSAAIAMGSLEQEADAKKSQAAPSDKDTAKGDAEKSKKKRVVKHHKARKRPADWDADFGMPAGTAYDVISRGDL